MYIDATCVLKMPLNPNHPSVSVCSAFYTSNMLIVLIAEKKCAFMSLWRLLCWLKSHAT